jgi:hypothetical protein
MLILGIPDIRQIKYQLEATNIGKRARMYGSVLMIEAKPTSSDFQLGRGGILNRDPSVRIIFFGFAIRNGSNSPIDVRTRNAI